MDFIKSEKIIPLAKKVFQRQKERITRINPEAEVNHVGATAIPGSITSGDLDIQVGAKKSSFEKTANGLKDLYHINHPELWTEEFALFHKKDHPQIPISIILCVSGSKYDEYTAVRDLLKNNQDILEEYNSLKRRYEGKSESAYKQAKREVFGKNGDSALLKKYEDRLD